MSYRVNNMVCKANSVAGVFEIFGPGGVLLEEFDREHDAIKFMRSNRTFLREGGR